MLFQIMSCGSREGSFLQSLNGYIWCIERLKCLFCLVCVSCVLSTTGTKVTSDLLAVAFCHSSSIFSGTLRLDHSLGLLGTVFDAHSVFLAISPQLGLPRLGTFSTLPGAHGTEQILATGFQPLRMIPQLVLYRQHKL